ncbi:5-bromo-4-chloroindolyl phosphate hydrolysis family protein [Vaginisenegalia massiliensis]|uniref:5-bromo-4-chloroindolyl phosphate hydrolysis family protein n=1 Tax=Vaginisenegalia massiliensis TaxID=2058294 RepID=UPI000F5329CD|nr:5-bromo-4-chloroindolyl phosphate hydrolysis family protein [Vaginisenegalia massiliensis]
MSTLYFWGNVALTILTIRYLYQQTHYHQGNKFRRLARKAFELDVVALILFASSTFFSDELTHFNASLILLLVCLSSVVLLALAFDFLKKYFAFSWLNIFYYIGLMLNVMMIAVYRSMAHPSFVDVTAFDALAPCLGIATTSNFIGLFSVGLLACFANLFSSNPKPCPLKRKPATKSKLQHYLDQGLTKEEIEYFRQQMSPAKEAILTIESQMSKNAKLRAIEARHNTVKVSQAYFKDIVDQPRRITDASDFIYKYLPSLVDLSHKYNEINGHVAKNKQTYLLLEKSAQTIEGLCQQITDAYLAFHEQDFNHLKDEIELANKNLIRIYPEQPQAKQDQANITEPSPDTPAQDGVTAILEQD